MANEEEEPVPVNDDEQAASHIAAEPQLQRVLIFFFYKIFNCSIFALCLK